MLWISNLSSKPALNFVRNHHFQKQAPHKLLQLLLLQQQLLKLLVLESLIFNIYNNFFVVSVVLITGGTGAQ